ncbi:TetR family transcriptional regulator [Cupriavidus basilensis OR16]|uniref:TetR family transcriptional regulator n=2 Tax=Cupriavidus basilensis TaxID=68895 RepID=H1SCQ8_9BURK|nr:TetR family transcriptional regulator [Cupriavidus basilensis OR16]
MNDSPSSTARTQRRRPAQSRSRATADAIREAFVQLLVEKGYEKVSIRQVIGLAGVGIGSFYEYFSSKDALAAVCIHLRVKAIAADMRASIAANRAEPLPVRVDALLDAQSAPALAEPEQWAALFLVERKVSGIEAFRRMYGEFMQLWVEALSAGPGWPSGIPAQPAAFAAHAMAYSLVSQALLTTSGRIDTAALRRMVGHAVHGYLSIHAPYAYRLYRFDPA